MKSSVHFLKTLTVETYTRGRDGALNHIAAGLAYYMLFAIAPLSIITVSAAGLFVESEELLRRALLIVSEIFGTQVGTLIENMVATASVDNAGLIATLVSVGFVLWGGARLILHLERAFDIIHYGEEIKDRGFSGVVLPRVKAFINLGLITFFIIISLIASLSVPLLLNFFYSILPIPDVLVFTLQSIGVLLLMALVFSGTFYFLGNKKISAKVAFVGGIAASFAFIILNAIFGIYVSNFSNTSLYGAAGSVLALLLWLYVTAQILLYGAVLSYVIEEKTS